MITLVLALVLALSHYTLPDQEMKLALMDGQVHTKISSTTTHATHMPQAQLLLLHATKRTNKTPASHFTVGKG
jgi:hypothetical protein